MLRQARWLHNNRGRVVVAPRGSLGALGRGRATRPTSLDVHAWLNDPTQRPVLLELLRDALGTRVDLQRCDLASVASLLTRGFESGELRARRMRIPSFRADRTEKPEEPPPPEETKDEHVLDFVFEYPNGDPAPGYEYVLIDPTGKRENGKLSGDATIHRDGVKPGSYGVHIKEVEKVSWDESVASVAEEMHLTAVTSGHPDGTAAKVRIFREYAEGDDEVVDRFDAQVKGDAVTTTYRYDDTKSDRKSQDGVIRLVAEVSIGTSWAKTVRPVELQLKTVVAVEWSPRHVQDGEKAKLLVRTMGYPEGTTAEVKLWRFTPDGDDLEVGTFSDVALVGDVGTLELAVALDTAKKKALEGTTIHWPGELHAEVTIGKDPARAAASKLLAVEPALHLLDAVSGQGAPR